MNGKEFLIRMMTYENDKEVMVKAFYSNNITELTKLYLFARDNEIEIDISFEGEGNGAYDGHEAYVKDVRVTFGGHEALTCLNVIVEVM